MNKKLISLLGIMICIVIAGGIVISLFGQKEEKKEKEDRIQVVTSFYPSYIIALNIADQIQGIEVKSLTDFSAGCLHDYQLTTDDMRLLASADLFLMNGGGMEGYIEDVVKNYPDLAIVDLSQDVIMLESEEHEGELNPHVWLDPSKYKTQVSNMQAGLVRYVEAITELSLDEREEIVKKIVINTEIYLRKINELEVKFDALIQGIQEEIEAEQFKKVVIFHDAFVYLADRAGLEVAYTVEIEGDTALSAGEIRDVIDLVNSDQVKYLFTEEQYGDTITDRIEEETDAVVYVIDSAVTGDGTKDSYINSMNQNLKILKEAFE